MNDWGDWLTLALWAAVWVACTIGGSLIATRIFRHRDPKPRKPVKYITMLPGDSLEVGYTTTDKAMLALGVVPFPALILTIKTAHGDALTEVTIYDEDAVITAGKGAPSAKPQDFGWTFTGQGRA